MYTHSNRSNGTYSAVVELVQSRYWQTRRPAVNKTNTEADCLLHGAPRCHLYEWWLTTALGPARLIDASSSLVAQPAPINNYLQSAARRQGRAARHWPTTGFGDCSLVMRRYINFSIRRGILVVSELNQNNRDWPWIKVKKCAVVLTRIATPRAHPLTFWPHDQCKPVDYISVHFAFWQLKAFSRIN